MTGTVRTAFERRIDTEVSTRSAVRLLAVVVAACALIVVAGAGAGAPGEGVSPSDGTHTGSATDHDTDFDNATPIRDGETLSNRSLGPDGPDLYAIDLDAGDRIDVTLDGQSGSLLITSPDRETAEATESDDRRRIAAVTATDGVHYVAVWDLDPEATYDISVSVGDPLANDDDEPNDDETTATRIEPGETLTDRRLPLNNGSWLDSVETDVYAVNLTAGTRLDATITGEGTEYVDVFVRDEEYVEFASSRYSDDDTTSLVADRNGTYYVMVGEFVAPKAYGVSSYTLSTSVSAAAPNDDYEPNDAGEPPTSVAVGETLSDLRIVAEESDNFAVNLTAGQRVTVSAVATDGGTVRLSAEDEPEPTVENGSLTYVAGSDGTYEFSVTNREQETTDYEFAVEDAGEVENDRFEPNDRIADAPTVPTGETLRNLRSLGPEEDFYAVEVSEPGVLNATVSASDGGLGPRVEIYERDDAEEYYHEPKGTLVATSADGQNPNAARLLVDSPGTYYVRALPDTGGAINYSLSAGVAAYPDNDRFEPNDNGSTAAPVSTNGTVSDLELAGDEWDYYGVDLREGQRYAVEIDSDATFTRVEMTAGIPNRTFVSRAFRPAEDGSLTFVAPETATYALGVRNTETPLLSYSLETNVTGQAPVDRFEPNDDVANATPIDGNTTLRDLRATGRETDVFAVSVNRSQVLRASVDSEQLTVGVRGPNDSGFHREGENATQFALTTGTYYVAVTSDGSDARNYTLETSVRAAANDPYEFNNDRASATPVPVGTNLTDLGLPPSDTDVFEVPASRSDRLFVASSTGVFSPDVEIRDAEGGDVVTETYGDLLSFRPVADAPYYVVVDSVNSRTMERYWLSVTDAANATDYEPDRLEPNDDRANASTLSTDANPEGLTVVPGDPDYYAVTLSEAAWLNASINSTDDARFDLLGPERVLESSYTTYGTTSVSKRLASGTYYLRVRSETLESQAYSLDVETNSDGVGTTMSVAPDSARLSVGESRTMAVTFDATRGVGGIEFNASLTNPAVANITSVDLYGEPDLKRVAIGPTNATAFLQGGYFAGRPASPSLVLGNVTVTATANGTTTLGLSDARASSRADKLYAVVDTENATLTVGESTPPTFAEAPPANLDDDEQYEDVDGDGDGDIFDALTYFNNRDSDAIRNNPDRYDFDGDGDSGDLFDALALYTELS